MPDRVPALLHQPLSSLLLAAFSLSAQHPGLGHKADERWHSVLLRSLDLAYLVTISSCF